MSAKANSRAGRVAALALALAPMAALGGAAVLAACSKGHEAVPKHHCPMHPTYVSDGPGDCPICGMRLVPMEKGGTAPAAADPHASHGSSAAPPPPGPAAPRAGSATEWVCPMDECDVHSDGPGRCPKCGMNLVERPAAFPAPPAPGGTAAAPPAGLAPVVVPAEARRLAGVQTVAARRARLERTVRAAGTVVADETRIRHVHAKIPGWIDRLHVDFTGRAVRKGEPLLDLYSPELLATQEEYLRAREAERRFATSSLPEVRRGGEELVRAARRRLELLDVPPGFLASIERTGRPRRTVPLLSPAAGVVTGKPVFEGQQVEPSMELFTVTDLSRVWVQAEVYAEEAGHVRAGDAATVTPADGTGTALAGRVSFVAPALDPQTRTLKVRLEFPNPDGALKPGQFADVRLALQAVEGIVVPDTAVLDTGTRQVVFVAGPDGAFTPREVTVGLRSDGRAEVRSGLRDGEAVAVAATFLLDSESRLRSALGAAP